MDDGTLADPMGREAWLDAVTIAEYIGDDAPIFMDALGDKISRSGVRICRRNENMYTQIMAVVMRRACDAEWMWK